MLASSRSGKWPNHGCRKRQSKFPESTYLPEITYELANCYQNLQKTAKSLELFEDVANKNRNEIGARARFMMGEVYFSQKEFAKAIQEFQKVMYGFGAQQAAEPIKNWQARSAVEAGRCAELLIGDLQGERRAKRSRLLAVSINTCWISIQSTSLRAKRRLASVLSKKCRDSDRNYHAALRTLCLWKYLCWLLFAMQLAMPIDVRYAWGQEGRSQENSPGVPSSEIQALESDARQAAANPVRATNAGKVEGMNFLTLMVRGGWFMVPIGVVSVLVVAIGLERAYVLRQSRLIPTGLVRSLGALARESESLDPKAAYRLCQLLPSATANVIRTMLLENGAAPCRSRRRDPRGIAARSGPIVYWCSLAESLRRHCALVGIARNGRGLDAVVSRFVTDWAIAKSKPVSFARDL